MDSFSLVYDAERGRKPQQKRALIKVAGPGVLKTERESMCLTAVTFILGSFYRIKLLEREKYSFETRTNLLGILLME